MPDLDQSQPRLGGSTRLRPRAQVLLEAAAAFVESPGLLGAAFGWPCFSLTSYRLVRRLLAQGVAPRTVLDVGANIGQFAVAASKLFRGPPRVVAFEPLPDCAVQLLRAVAGLSEVEVRKMALGERAGRAPMHVNVHRHASSLLRVQERHTRAFPFAREERVEDVPVSTLDAEFAASVLSRPVLLKIDVQGYELPVLRGGTELLRQVDHVVVETSFTPLYEAEPLFADVLALMLERGFRFLRPVGWLSDPANGEILQMDALFARPR